MPIADYLNKLGQFILLQKPELRVLVPVERGKFALIPAKECERARGIRFRYIRFLRAAAFPLPIYKTIYYIPTQNCLALEQRTLRLVKTWKSFATEIKQDWVALTDSARAVMVDTLTVRWLYSSCKKTMTQGEYLGKSLSDFDRAVARGPKITQPSYTYCKLFGAAHLEPKLVYYKTMETSFWHWLLETDALCSKYIQERLRWLLSRVAAYKAVTNKVYVHRSWNRDIKLVHFDHYTTWLSILGRKEAMSITKSVHSRLAKFYGSFRDKNKMDGSFTSRLAAIEFLSTLAPDLDAFVEAMRKPLDVDSLIATAEEAL